MTGLLVSVRDAAEALAALAGGAHLIDIKEPRRGSLGAADPTTIADIVQAVAGRVPVSAALGELLEPHLVSSQHSPTNHLAGLSFAKLGLAGCRHRADWPRRWARALECLPTTVAPVAVVYADHATAMSPLPADTLRHARALHCRAVLLDTFDKSRGGLLDLWTLADVDEFVRAARLAGLMVVLAGSLDQESSYKVLPFQPDYIAVRGAVCAGDRTGDLQTSRVRDMAALVKHGSSSLTTG